MVALESTVITHGLPRPINLELARRMEVEVSREGAIPATVAVLDGRPYIGLTPDHLEHLALTEKAVKISRRDLAAARVKGLTGGTTVSATMYMAAVTGIQVFATGGIGGVHKGSSGDISADLPELARTPMIVVCSGAKSILDLPRTLEWLETAGVPVVGWQTDEFPGFISESSGLAVPFRADTAEEIAHLMQAQGEMGLSAGLLVCVPCPTEEAVPAGEVNKAMAQAEELADAQSITGKELTPFLLARLSELTDGATLRANLSLLRNNASIAAAISKAVASSG